MNYTEMNAKTVDGWVTGGWEWGTPISHEIFEHARRGDWDVVLTPTKPVPHEWFCPMKGAEILGLASGGGQQMPVFTACGAHCTVLDYSEQQLEQERRMAELEGYDIQLVRADMTKPLPFADASFDLIFHPVSNCYIEEVESVWKECFRVLRPGGILLAGLDNGIAYAFNEELTALEQTLPYNPLKDPALYEASVKNNWGIQFSHTVEEQVGGQLKAGFVLTDIFQDTDGQGNLHEHGLPTFFATRAVKPDRAFLDGLLNK